MKIQAYIVSAGLVIICVAGMILNYEHIAYGALCALAGWLGGNANGQRKASA